MHPRILIVGTVPYNKRSPSRAFEAYFHNWEKENCAQIFSDSKKPCKGHCGKLYQITDYSMLRRWFKKNTDAGKAYCYEELPDEWESVAPDVDSDAAKRAYKIGRKHTALTHILRGILWKKKYWFTKELCTWLDEFAPECVFLSFSNDYFILRIAYCIARKYNVPIVSSIGDDYYFDTRFSINPFYWIYKCTYKALVRKVLQWKGSAIYISDKIRDKYNSAFGLDGETVYLTSTVKRKNYAPINKEKIKLTYFGNIRMGRNRSLNEIGMALGNINPNFILEVYSGELDRKYYKLFESNPNVFYGGSISYSEVQNKMTESDITVIVEGFAKKDINKSRYSLSTKAADTLASGAAVLTYGSEECGIIEYMKKTDASMVCTDKQQLEQSIRKLIDDESLQRRYYDNAIKVMELNHNLQSSSATFENVVHRALEKE